MSSLWNGYGHGNNLRLMLNTREMEMSARGAWSAEEQQLDRPTDEVGGKPSHGWSANSPDRMIARQRIWRWAALPDRTRVIDKRLDVFTVHWHWRLTFSGSWCEELSLGKRSPRLSGPVHDNARFRFISAVVMNLRNFQRALVPETRQHATAALHANH
jgi:hypothetical protein